MFSKVLVPIDGTESSESIIPVISGLARGLGMNLTLLYVQDPDALDLSPNAYAEFGPWETAVRERMDGLTLSLAADGVTAEYEVRYGRAVRVILATIEEGGYDLVALSTKGRGLLGIGMMGSVTYRVAQSSKSPVLIVSPSYEAPDKSAGTAIQTIIVGMDGSAISESALPHVVSLARGLKASVILIRAVTGASSYPIFFARSAMLEAISNAKIVAGLYLEKLAVHLMEQGVSVEARVVEGSPAQLLVDIAERTPNSMIVVTSHGDSGFVPDVLGSVSINVARAAHNPVLVVPPPRELRKASD